LKSIIEALPSWAQAKMPNQAAEAWPEPSVRPRAEGRQMCTSQSEELPDAHGLLFAVAFDSRPATFAEVISAWQCDSGFRSQFNALQADAPDVGNILVDEGRLFEPPIHLQNEIAILASLHNDLSPEASLRAS
jgi:hypothetical protein